VANQKQGAEYYILKTWIQTRNKTRPWWTQTQQSSWNKNCVSKGDRTVKSVWNLLAFWWSMVERQKLTRRHMMIPHGQPEIWYHLMIGWFLIFWEVEVSRLMEISMLMNKALSRRIKTMQSLHHGSVGYQHARTLVGLTKKAKFLQIQPRTQARKRKNATKL
jgi:hypothetical protein